MPDLLFFEWRKDTAGYRIETEPPDPPEEANQTRPNLAEARGKLHPVGRTLLHRDEPTEYVVGRGGPMRLCRPLAGNAVLYKQLEETAQTPEGVLAFASEFGQLDHPEGRTPLDTWYRAIENFRRTARYAESGRPAEFAREWNAATSRLGRLSARFDPRPYEGRPFLRLVPETLHHAIWLQLAQHVSNAQAIQRCRVCPTWFTYGPGTGRRSSGDYCSPKCRKAAYKARNR